MTKREWIKPVHTEGVSRFGEQPMQWVFEGKPRQLYYCIAIWPHLGSTAWKLSTIDMPTPIDGPRGELGYIVSMFQNGDGNVQTMDSGITGAARRTVIELRKRVLRHVKEDRQMTTEDLGETSPVLSPPQSALEPLQSASVGG